MALGPVFIDLEGTSLLEHERDLLRHPNVGGLTLFARNYASREQIAELIGAVRGVRAELLVAVDHEGGRVQRFREGFSAIPAMATLGQLYDREPEAARRAARDLAWLMASELRSVGVDFSYAPVLDVNDGRSRVLGDRALHADANVVADLGSALMAGLADAGCAAVGKHFPGHGGIVEDTHVQGADDARSLAQLEQCDLRPFKRLIAEGLAGIMPAHVRYTQIDPQPASGSAFWLQDLLREQLGFRGAVLSDDLSMAAAGALGDACARTQAALVAGCDVALLCNDPEACAQVLEGLPVQACAAREARLTPLRGRGECPSGAALARHPRWAEAERWRAQLSEQ